MYSTKFLTSENTFNCISENFAQGLNVQTLRFLLSVTAKPIVHDVVCTALNSKSNCNNIYYFLNFQAFTPAHLLWTNKKAKTS